MAKERAPRRRRRWFLLALLVGAVTWYVRSRSSDRSGLPAAPWPAAPPATPSVHPSPPAAMAPATFASPAASAPEKPAAPENESSATADADERVPDSAPVVGTKLDIAAESRAAGSDATTGRHEASATDDAQLDVTDLVTPSSSATRHAVPERPAPDPATSESAAVTKQAGSGSAADEKATSEAVAPEFLSSAPDAPHAAAAEPVAPASAGVQPAVSVAEVAEPVVVQPPAGAGSVTEHTTAGSSAAAAGAKPAADPAADAPTAGPSPRPRPRPRPHGSARAGTQVQTPPAGSAWVGEDTPSSGFGPTSAPPAPEHALFTPASTDGVGAGAVPGPDGEAPAPEYTIKGNADSMHFHTPESPAYERTRAEVWFRTADEAVAAGFTEWRPRRRTG